MEKDLEQILNKVGTIENDKAMGELFALLIESNLSVSKEISELTNSISKYSEQSSMTNKRLLWLTLIMAFSALISSSYYLYLFIK